MELVEKVSHEKVALTSFVNTIIFTSNGAVISHKNDVSISIHECHEIQNQMSPKCNLLVSY